MTVVNTIPLAVVAVDDLAGSRESRERVAGLRMLGDLLLSAHGCAVTAWRVA